MRNMRIMPGAGEADGVWHLSLSAPGPADVNKLLLYRNKNGENKSLGVLWE